jgi:hypothetical protein
LKSRTHEKRGWLWDKLLHHNLMEANSESYGSEFFRITSASWPPLKGCALH